MPEIEDFNNRKIFPFIQGETVDLCIPNVDEDVIGEWSHWFNDPETTRDLNHGVFSNTIDDQKAYLEQVRRNKDRIFLLIRPKKADYCVGVASLSLINFETQRCYLSHVISKRVEKIESISIH